MDEPETMQMPEASSAPGRRGARPVKPSRREQAFRTHLTVYLVFAFFFFSLNLLTSSGDWWFYWPLFFWGWALVFHAVGVFGADAPARVIDALRSLVPGFSGTPAAVTTARPANAAPFAAAAFAAAHERVLNLSRIAAQLPAGPVRDRAFRIVNEANTIIAIMANDRRDGETVEWFNNQLLAPIESLLGRYQRLSTRGVAGAEEILRRVEEQNLPLIEARLDALYDQLHRGDIIDLAVESEMLDLELLDAPPQMLRTKRQRFGSGAPDFQSRLGDHQCPFIVSALAIPAGTGRNRSVRSRPKI